MRKRKIKFPLVMKDDVKVRTLEDLRLNFDLEKTLAYYESGKLVRWLNDHYEDDIAEQVTLLDRNGADIVERLCSTLGVEGGNIGFISLEYIRAKNEKLEKVKQITDDKEIINNFDKVAFTQEELDKLLDADNNVIYLYGETFAIAPAFTDVTIIGLNNPQIDCGESKKKDYDDNRIAFKNVVLPTNFPTYNIETGCKVTIGNYHNNSLLWKVLYIDDDKAFLLSEKCVDTLSPMNLLLWLNGSFYQDAFTDGEKEQIFGTNSRALLSNSSLFNRDKPLNLLTASDAIEYLGKGNLIAYSFTSEPISWLVRKSSGSSNYYFVDKSGELVEKETTAIRGVRPAMWVKINEDLLKLIV